MPRIKNIYLNLTIYNDLCILMIFIRGRDVFSNLSTEDLFLDLFSIHFSITGFFLKPYIRPLTYTSQVSKCSATCKTHHWCKWGTNIMVKLHHSKLPTRTWMSHWASVSPVSLRDRFMFSPLHCLAHFLVHLFTCTENKPHFLAILAYKDQC